MITESVYFFKNSDNSRFDTKIFDIKEYLMALGSEASELIEDYRGQYGCIEEEYVTEWIDALLPYFKSKKSVEGIKLTTQNEIYLEEKGGHK